MELQIQFLFFMSKKYNFEQRVIKIPRYHFLEELSWPDSPFKVFTLSTSVPSHLPVPLNV
jgi:hypothetical protein